MNRIYTHLTLRFDGSGEIRGYNFADLVRQLKAALPDAYALDDLACILAGQFESRKRVGESLTVDLGKYTFTADARPSCEEVAR